LVMRLNRNHKMTSSNAYSEEEEYILGIDEAGRGPVLGPMVYGAVYCKIEYREKVKEIFQVDDSKVLSAEHRERIYNNMTKTVDKNASIVNYFVKVLNADELSQNMLRRSKYNLNEMSHHTAMDLIQQVLNALAKKKRCVLKEVYVDTVGDPKKYQTMLEEKFPEIGQITVSKKADSLFPVVSAASIVAKVTRDRMMAEIEQKHNNKMGSGYPNDPSTKKWLDKNTDKVFGFPYDVVRFSWNTVTKLFEKNGCVQVEWSDDEEDEVIVSQPKLKKPLPRCSMLQDWGLEVVSEF
jgi:ribonuclease H2 subunit A